MSKKYMTGHNTKANIRKNSNILINNEVLVKGWLFTKGSTHFLRSIISDLKYAPHHNLPFPYLHLPRPFSRFSL